jgi:hypothetical protein
MSHEGSIFVLKALKAEVRVGEHLRGIGVKITKLFIGKNCAVLADGRFAFVAAANRFLGVAEGATHALSFLGDLANRRPAAVP